MNPTISQQTQDLIDGIEAKKYDGVIEYIPNIQKKD